MFATAGGTQELPADVHRVLVSYAEVVAHETGGSGASEADRASALALYGDGSSLCPPPEVPLLIGASPNASGDQSDVPRRTRPASVWATLMKRRSAGLSFRGDQMALKGTISAGSVNGRYGRMADITLGTVSCRTGG